MNGTPSKRALGGALVVTLAATWALAHAQEEPIVDVAAVRGRLGAERSCIERHTADLTQWNRLVAETQRELAAAPRGSVAETEAAHAFVVLEGRVRTSAAALIACVPAAEPELALEDEADPTPTWTALSVHLRAGEPVRERGGELDSDAVHRALLGVGRAFDGCYESLAERHAIVRGDATLRLTIGADGHPSAHTIEGLTMGDAAFQRCVQQALAHVSPTSRPRGGAAHLRIPLSLGPEG